MKPTCIVERIPRWIGSRCGDEDERRAIAEVKLLADLRLVPVLADAVRLEVAEQLREGEVDVGLLAGAGDAALRVADHRLLAVDGERQRPQREQDRGRIAAGIGDQPRFLQLAVAVLGQAVDRFAEKLRALVVEAVPRRIHRRLFEPKRAGEVDDPHAVVEQLRREIGGDFVRRAEEDDLRLRGDERLDRERLGDELRQRGRDRSARGAARREERDELDLVMARKDGRQLGAGVAGGADDGDTLPCIDVRFSHGRGFREKLSGRVRRRTPMVRRRRSANAEAADGVRKATKMVSSPPMVPRTPSIERGVDGAGHRLRAGGRRADDDEVAGGVGAGDVFSDGLLQPRLHDVARREGDDRAAGEGVARDVAVRRLGHAELAQVARERRLRDLEAALLQQRQQLVLRMDGLVADDAKDLVASAKPVPMRMNIHRREFLCIPRRMSTGSCPLPFRYRSAHRFIGRSDHVLPEDLPGALVVASVLLAVHVAAEQPNNASGSVTVNGQATALHHAYARYDAQDKQTRVLITDRALDATMLAEESSGEFSGEKPSFRQLSKSGEATGIELFINDANEVETVEVFSKAFGMPTPITARKFWYEPSRLSAGWIGGHSRIKEAETFFKLVWQYDVSFLTTIGQKGFEIPAAPALAAARKANDALEAARILPAGGGEEGAAYLAFRRSLDARDGKAMLSAMTASMKSAVAKEMHSSPLTESALGSWAFMQTHARRGRSRSSAASAIPTAPRSSSEKR